MWQVNQLELYLQLYLGASVRETFKEKWDILMSHFNVNIKILYKTTTEQKLYTISLFSLSRIMLMNQCDSKNCHCSKHLKD